MQKVVNITVAGLGGQGVLTVTDIIAEVMFRARIRCEKERSARHEASAVAPFPAKCATAKKSPARWFRKAKATS